MEWNLRFNLYLLGRGKCLLTAWAASPEMWHWKVAYHNVKELQFSVYEF
jgi:hypothetical protein